MAYFGEGFQYREYVPVNQLENGEYDAIIESITDGQYSNGNTYLSVRVRIKDHPGYVPNTITIENRPVLGVMKANGKPVEQKDLDLWDGRVSRFFDSFGIQEKNFSNILGWKNHVGRVKCDWQYDKNEADHKSKQFKQLTPIVPKTNKAPAKTVPTGYAVQTAAVPPQVKAVQGVMNGVTEDIPF